MKLTLFSWFEYIQETGSEVASSSLFPHVESSFQPLVPRNSVVEMQYSSGKWWQTTCVLMCGSLLYLRYRGLPNSLDNRSDFCIDLAHSSSLTLQPVGWCEEHKLKLTPPPCLPDTTILPPISNVINIEIKSKTECDLSNGIEVALPLSADLINNLRSNPSGRRFVHSDLIRDGGYLECQHELDPLTVWPVKVLVNTGGRLKLTWFGCNTQKLGYVATDFYLFYTHHRLHQLGWAKSKGYKYQAPSNLLLDREISNIDAFLRGTPCAIPFSLFGDSLIPIHSFEVGWKLEAVEPRARHQLRPATIVEIINEIYFIVEMDDLREPSERQSIRFLCHSGCPLIMPANASSVRGIKLTPPPGWNDTTSFSWAAYFEQFPGVYAPYESHFRCNRYEDLDSGSNNEDEFMLGVKLEAVNPLKRSEICPATVTRIYGRLMWIHLDSESSLSPDIMVDTKSCDLFPVGWCDLVGHPLKPPSTYNPSSPYCNPDSKQTEITAEDYCPRLYFNYRCYSGSYLSKSGMESLPQYVGPGKVINVMEEVLLRLINISHKPLRVLHDFEVEENNQHDLMSIVPIEIKSPKGNILATPVELPKYTRTVEEFCRQIGLLLEACPHLVSQDSFGRFCECPEGCSARTKAKFIEKLPHWKRRYYTSKPLAMLSLSYKALKASASHDHDNDGRDGGGESDSSSTSAESKCPEPPTKMQTRGIRVPSYVFLERRKRRQPVIPSVLVSTTDISHDTSDGPVLKKAYIRNDSQPPSDLQFNDISSSTHIPHNQQSHLDNIHLLSSQSKDKADLVDCNGINMNGNGQPRYHPYLSPHQQAAPYDPILLAGEIPPIRLDSNPLLWTPNQLSDYLRTTDCAWIENHFRDEGVDGQAFMLLTFPIVRRLMGLRFESAICLCRHVVRLKRAFIEQYTVKFGA